MYICISVVPNKALSLSLSLSLSLTVRQTSHKLSEVPHEISVTNFLKPSTEFGTVTLKVRDEFCVCFITTGPITSCNSIYNAV